MNKIIRTLLLKNISRNLRLLFLVPFSFFLYDAHAAEFKLSGYGTAGMIDPDFNEPVFIGDFRVRGEVNHLFGNAHKIGAVYAYDEIAMDRGKFARDAFLFYENANLGRVEVGLTTSVARKFGVGLPDVGGLRINEKPLFFKKIPPAGAVISDTVLNSGRYSPRVNFATPQIGGWQYGVSAAGLSDTFDYAADIGAKHRSSTGKTKTAISFGASFMDNLENHTTDMYAPKTTADWRAQGYVGLNLQYNSWLVGITGRAIYDQNAIGAPTDGIHAGAGVSYDLLKYSVSTSYLFSDIGIWDSGFEDYATHSGILSFRYKYSEYMDIWMSTGITTDTPFVSAALRLTF